MLKKHGETEVAARDTASCGNDDDKDDDNVDDDAQSWSPSSSAFLALPSLSLSLALSHSHFSALPSFRNLDGTTGRDWTTEGIAEKERRGSEGDNGRTRKGSRTKGSKEKGGCYRRISERTLARYERR